MSEFDIRIGTQLDTSEAESQLKAFIEKYSSDTPINLKLDVKGMDKLATLETSLKNIQTLAKGISEIKINVGNSIGSVKADLSDEINNNLATLASSINTMDEKLVSLTQNRVSEGISDTEQQVAKLQSRISTIVDNLETLKVNPLSDTKSIDGMIADLKLLQSTNFKIDDTNLESVRQQVNAVSKSYKQLSDSANNLRLQESFTSLKVDPILKEMSSVKEVLSAKGLDTSWIDSLISRMSNLKSSTADLKTLKSSFAELKGDFTNLKATVDVSSVKSAETAIKNLLNYRNDLNKKIMITTDTSQVQKLQSSVEKVDNTINKLKSDLTSASVGNIGNLIDNADIQNVENLKKQYDNLTTSLEKYKQKTQSIKGDFGEFIDVSKLKAVDEYINKVEADLKALNFNNLKASDLSGIINDFKVLDSAIDQTVQSSSQLKLTTKVDLDLAKTTAELNGFKSALIATGQACSEIGRWESTLGSIKGLINAGEYQQAVALMKSLRQEMESVAKTDFNFKDISGGISQFKQLASEVDKLQKKLSSTSNSNIASGLDAQISKIQSAMKQLESTFDSTQKKIASGFKESFSGNDFTSQLNKMVSSVQKLQSVANSMGSSSVFSHLTSEGGKLSAEYDKLQSKIVELGNKLRTAMDTGNIDQSGINKLQQEIMQTLEYSEQLSKIVVNVDCSEAIAQLNKLEAEMTQVGKDTSGIKTLKATYQGIADQVNAGTKSYAQASKEISNANKQASSFNTTTSTTGKTLGTVGSSIERMFSSVKQSFSNFGLGMLVADGLTRSVYAIKEAVTGLDEAKTELARVLPENVSATTSNLNSIASEARSIAIEVGQSTEDVIVGMSTALQAGANNMQQASEIARSSAIFQNVTDMGADDASQAVASLISQYYSMDTALSQVDSGVGKTVQGYNNLTEAMDLVNYAGNNFAISSEGVSQALQRGGSVLSNYGVSLVDSVAMIAGANESLQNPEKVGNGLKTIAINLAGIKTSATDGTLSLNKTALALQEVAGIDVFTDSSKTQVKDMTSLMEELYTKWGDLSGVEQAGIAEAVAGKNQAQVFQALMGNWERVRQFQQEYNEGWMVGSAQKENTLYLDSIAGKWNTLKENMKSLVTGNLSSDLFKGLLEGANNVVVAIDKISSSLGKIGTVGAIAGLVSLVNTMSKLSTLTPLTALGGFSKLGQSISNVFNASTQMGSFKAGLTAIKGEMGALVSSSTLATVAMGALKAVLVGITFGVIIAGITATVKAIDNHIHATENAVKASQEMQASIRDEMQTLNTQKSTLTSIATEYDTLANKTNKTAEEMSRFNELKKEIASAVPELVSGYDVNGNPILQLNGSLSEYIGNLDEAIAKQQKLFNQQVNEEANAYLRNSNMFDKNELQTYETQLDSLLGKLNRQETSGFLKDDLGSGTAQQMAKEQIKAIQDRVDFEEKALAKLSETREKQLLADEAIQAKYTNKLAESNDKLTERQQQSMQNFMNTLDWSQFQGNEAGANSFFNGISDLAEKTAYTVKEMSADMQEATRSANAEFEKTGAINAYGQSLEEIGKKYDTFDMTSWGNYLDEVNGRYESGAMTLDQYEYSLGHMADTLSELTGIDASVWLDSLKGSSDIATAFENANSGLSSFLQAYDSSITKLNSGDSLAVALEKQFEGISNFGEDLRYQLSTTGEIDVEWLVNEQAGNDLPAQMDTLIDGIISDNEVTEVEQKVLVGIQTEIQNEGQLSQDTVDKLQGLYDGTLEVDGKMTIAGIELSAKEAQSLADSLQKAKENGESLDFSNTGIEDMVKSAKEAQNALSTIKDVNLKSAFEKAGIDDTAQEVEALKSALELIPEDKRVDFVTDCASAFQDVSSLEEGLNNIPPMKKLEYNIGVEGDEKLEQAKATLDELPEGVKTAVFQSDVVGLEDLELVKQLVEEVGESQATAIINADTTGIINGCTTVEEYLQALSEAGIINLTTEADTSALEEVKDSVSEVTEGENVVELTTEADTSALEETDESIEEIKDTSGEPITIKIETEADTSGADEAKEKVESLPETKESVVKLKAEDEGLSEGIEKKEQAEQDGESTTYFNLIGKEEFDDTLSKKEQAEQDGESTTSFNLVGKEEFDDALSKKEQAEQDGESTTYFNLIGKEEFGDAIDKKEQAEQDGEGTTHFNLIGKDEFDDAINKKEEAEQEGESITEIIVNGMEQLSEINETLQTISDSKQVSVDISFNMADTVDTILSRLGIGNNRTEKVNVEISVKGEDKVENVLNKVKNAKAEVEVKITAKDEATKVLNEIEKVKSKSVEITITADDQVTSKLNEIQSMTGKEVRINVTANGVAQVKMDLTTIAGTSIQDKSFNVTANTGTVSSQLSLIALQKIQDKSFSITCTDTASFVVNKISATKIEEKRFGIVAVDNASTILTSVQNVKLKDKKFSINCIDNASGILSSIKSKIAGISGKTVTITAVYRTSGAKPAGLTGSLAKSTPQVQDVQAPVVQTLDASASALVSNAKTLSNAQAGVSAYLGVNNADMIDAIEFNVDLLTNMTNAIKKLTIALDTLAEKEEYAFGQQRVNVLMDETDLIQQQQKLLSQQKSDMQSMASSLKSYLQSEGFNIGSDGTINNYNAQLIAMEKNVKKLQEAYDDYESDDPDDTYKDTLKDRYDEANEELQKVKSATQEYNNLVFNEIPEVEKEYASLNNELAKIKNEIYEARQEQANFYNESKITLLTSQYRDLSNAMDILDSRINLAGDKEKVELYQQQLDLLTQQQRKQDEILGATSGQMAFYKEYLGQNGFTFDSNGYMTNGAEQLNKLANEQNVELESLKDAYESYLDLQDELSDGRADWWALQESIQDVKDEIQELKDAEIEALETMHEMIKEAGVEELTNQYDALNNALDLLESKMEGVFGDNQVNYMRQQLVLLEKQKTKQEELITLYTRQSTELRNQLQNWGLIFDEMGQMLNYDEVMSWQSSVESMEELKDLVEEYIDIQNDGLAESNKEWVDLNNEIQNVKDSILEANIAMQEMKDDAWTERFDSEINRIQGLIDTNEAKSELAGANQNELLEERLHLYKQLKSATEEALSYQETKVDALRGTLVEYGFVVDDNGSVLETVDHLEALKNTLSDDEFDYINDSLSEYFDVLYDEIPGLEEEILNLQKEYEDIQREKLEITEDIEKEITKIYEEQIDARIEKIEEERDKQVEALEEAQKEYKKWRDEVDYNNDYEEQLKTVEDLQNQIEIAKRDTSLSGQKRLQDLMDDLKEEQTKLEKLVQDKIDDDIDSMFDDAIDDVKNTADDEIKSIEDLWNDSKIAEMIQQSLSTGLFTDIDGNIQALDSALMDFANNSSDYLGVMGASLKSELLDNLSVAVETIKQMKQISEDLQLPDYSKYTDMIATQSTNTDIANGEGATLNTNNFTFGDTNIIVEGTADSSTIEEIQELLDTQKEDIINEITKNIN